VKIRSSRPASNLS